MCLSCVPHSGTPFPFSGFAMPTMSMGSAASITAEGTRHVQPGDGSCLFHSLMAAVTLLGLQLQSRICTAISLRRILLRWLVAHASKSYMGMSRTSWLRAERQQPKPHAEPH